MKRNGMTRRDLFKRFGALAFMLTPIGRAMGYIQANAFEGAPRFVMFFKGPAFHAPTVKPTSSIDNLPAPLAPLSPHARDIILFSGMSILGGSPKSDDYHEEHGGGLFGCVTGNSYRYSKNDSYYAYTDHPSFDIALATHYQTIPRLAVLPFSSLHLGAGAHSDADSVGLGQRYISFRARKPGDAQYGNAIEPIQNAGQVYEMLMERVNLICSKGSPQPGSTPDKAAIRAALVRKKSLIDFRLEDIADAKRELGMDSEHAQKLDGMVAGWRDVEKVTTAELAALDMPDPGGGGVKPCPNLPKPTGDGEGKNDCDKLSSVHDQMIGLIKLAFEWDLTRVVAFTLSGASSGHRWPSMGVNKAHHSLEHDNDVDAQNLMGSYFSGKFANLLAALKSVDDGDGHSALYNSAVMLGMECWSDSSSGHYMKDIPFILAGQAAGKFQTGRVVSAGGRSNNDLFVSIQNAAGIASNTFGLASVCKGPIL